MVKKTRKLFAILLALSVLMSAMSITVVAEEGGDPEQAPVPAQELAPEAEPTLNATVQVFDYTTATNGEGLGLLGYKFFNGAGKTLAKDGNSPSGSGAYNKPEMSDSLVGGYPYVDGSYVTVDKETGEETTVPVQGSMEYLFDSTYRVGSAMQEGGGLFQRDEQGYWYYDSLLNSAYYNPAKGMFELSETLVMPSWNPNNTTNEAKGNFLPFNKPTEGKVSEFPFTYTNAAGTEVSRTVHTLGTVGHPVNLWFGLEVEFEFYMTEGGMIGDKEMIFDFHGDDDVFVYIDDQLVLDIGGTHGAQSGSINFATGEVEDPTTEAGAEKSLKSIFNLPDDTFEDYSKHTLKFFYMERGGNISYCSLKFNLPVVPAGRVIVEKEISGELPGEEYAEYEYEFRLLDSENNPVANKPYSLSPVENTGNQTDENGVFKLMAGEKAYFADFTSEEEGKRYTVEEINVPSFCAVEDAEKTFTVRVGKTAETSVVFTNTMKTGKFSFAKTDTSGQPLSGADFTLVGEGYRSSATSNSKGTVTFDNVPFGTLTLSEIDAPSGYEAASGESWEVLVSYVNGEVEISLDDYIANEDGVLEIPGQEPVMGEDGAVQSEGSAAVPFIVENKKLNEIVIEKTVTVDNSEFDAEIGDQTEPALDQDDFVGKTFVFDIIGESYAGEPVERVARLTIKKTVNEEIEVAEGEEKEYIYGGSTTVKNLPAGEYTVTERIDDEDFRIYQNVGYLWTVNTVDCTDDHGIVVEVDDGSSEEVQVDNMFTHIPNRVWVEAEKIWDDDNDRDGLRPDSVTFGLYVIGHDQSETLVEAKAVTEDAEGAYKVSFLYDGLAYPGTPVIREIAYSADGDPVDLADVNGAVPGYEVPVVECSYSKGLNKWTFEVTNTHVPEVIDLAVRKVWDESAAGREKEVVVTLHANGKQVEKAALNADNGWYHIFENAFVNDGGEPIRYTVTEQSLGTRWSYAIDEVERDEFMTLFTVPVYTEESARAELELTVEGWAEMEAEAQQSEIDRLVGQPIPPVVDYDVEFEEVDFFYVVTNSYNPGGGGGGSDTVSYRVTKVWNDDNNAAGARPESISVQLLDRNGDPYGSAVALNEANGWSYQWTNIPVGREVSLVEVDVPAGYTSEIVERGTRFTVTNTYGTEEIPEEEVPLNEIPDDGDGESDGGGELDIPEEEVPLADVPATGDSFLLWTGLAAASGLGFAWLSIPRKREEDEG